MAYQDFLLDKRIVQRHIDKGFVDAKLLEKAIKDLPDRAENVTSSALEADADGDVLSMSTSCMIQLGEIADPDGQYSTDLEAARHTIEILQMLDEKTEGRLTGEEDRMLSHVIADLRTRYRAKYHTG
jgi:hypothetical protein